MNIVWDAKQTHLLYGKTDIQDVPLRPDRLQMSKINNLWIWISHLILKRVVDIVSWTIGWVLWAWQWNCHVQLRAQRICQGAPQVDCLVKKAHINLSLKKFNVGIMTQTMFCSISSKAWWNHYDFIIWFVEIWAIWWSIQGNTYIYVREKFFSFSQIGNPFVYSCSPWVKAKESQHILKRTSQSRKSYTFGNTCFTSVCKTQEPFGQGKV